MNPLDKEVFEYLKSKYLLPENITSLTLNLGVDSIAVMQCEFYPVHKLTAEQALTEYLRGKS
jgi:hypothetical protein